MSGEFTKQETGGAAVKTVMRAIGLVPPDVLAGTMDRTAAQFWTLATEVGKNLMDEFEWQALGREQTIITDGITTSYALSEDWNGFYSDAEWNRTTRLPAVGALEESEWQMLQARSLGGATFASFFRINDDTVEFYSAGTSGQTLVFPYRSRSWVVQADGVTYRDNLMNDDDVVRYDPQLFKAALKLAWIKAKRFDITDARDDYDTALSSAKGKDAPSRTLSLRRRGGWPLLGLINIPETGYGT